MAANSIASNAASPGPIPADAATLLTQFSEAKCVCGKPLKEHQESLHYCPMEDSGDVNQCFVFQDSDDLIHALERELTAERAARLKAEEEREHENAKYVGVLADRDQLRAELETVRKERDEALVEIERQKQMAEIFAMPDGRDEAIEVAGLALEEELESIRRSGRQNVEEARVSVIRSALAQLARWRQKP